MMKTVLALISVAVAVAAAADTYPSTYDNINLDDIIHNDRLLNKYVECLLAKDDVKCTPDAIELKRALPEALKTHCAKCTEKQKQGAEKVIEFMMKNKQELWTKIASKFDPYGEYAKQLKKN